MMNPVLGIVLFLVLFCGLFLCLRLLQKRHSLHPEVMRKFVHVGMGILCLSLPWVFNSIQPVFFLAIVSLLCLTVLRGLSDRETGLASVLHGVGRNSLGEIYFVVSVFLLFALSHHEPLLFCIPLLVLTWADAMAAIIGVRFGKHAFSSRGDRKTAEGSLSFFLAAFLSITIPLALFSETRLIQAVTIGALLSLIVTLLEAIAIKGRDNLYLPFGCYALLAIFLNDEPIELGLSFMVLLILLGVVYLWRRRTTLDDAALMGGALAGYAAWAIGGWLWVLPPLILLIGHAVIFPVSCWRSRVKNDIHVAISITGAALFWLILKARFPAEQFFYPYTIAFMTELAIIGVVRLAFKAPSRPPWHFVLKGAGWAWLLMLVPILLYKGEPWGKAICLVWGGFCAAAMTFCFYSLQPGVHHWPIESGRWLRQGLLGGIASFLGYLPLFFLGGTYHG